MSRQYQSRGMGFLEAISEWARRSESRQISAKNHNPREGSPDWETTFGMDFSWCPEHHMLTPNIGLRFDSDLRESSSTRKLGCTCPSYSRVTLSELRGHVDGSAYGIKNLRAAWHAAYTALKKPTSNGRDRLSGVQFQKQQSDEFIAWIQLWSSVWELANKRRRQVVDIEAEEWTEEEQECLIQHREDVLERGGVSKVTAYAYCSMHDDIGDSLPVRQPSRYLNCGICLAPVQENEDTRMRSELAKLKKQPSEFAKMVEYGIIKPEEIYQAMANKERFSKITEETELKQAQTDASRRTERTRDNRKRREPDQYEEEENDYTFLFPSNNNNNTDMKTEELKSDDEDMRY